MSRTEFNRLLEDARQQPLLLEELRGRLPDLQAALQWAQEKGYHLAEEEITQLRDSDRELSDEELDEAAGGDWSPPPPPPPPPGTGGDGGG